MKYSILIILVFTSTGSIAQSSFFYDLLYAGKAEFNRREYLLSVINLEKAIKLNPEHAEARYYLAYAYSRLNSPDGNSLTNMSLPLVLKTSSQLETVNKLTPKYDGKIIIQDPYSKITSEWGALALKYCDNKKSDSMAWAFRQGKKRGGFSEFVLAVNRRILKLCSKDAILVTEGDQYTFPLLYLQSVEGLRKDISVVDIRLLYTDWYPSFLSRNKIVRFDMPVKRLTDLSIRSRLTDSIVKMGEISWNVRPSTNYIFRGGCVLISMLKKNNLKRNVYFTMWMEHEYKMGLNNHLQTLVVADMLSPDEKSPWDNARYETEVTGLLRLIPLANPNSMQELTLADNIRSSIFCLIDVYIGKRDRATAARILNLVDQYAHESNYPYQDEESKRYVQHLRKVLYK